MGVRTTVELDGKEESIGAKEVEGQGLEIQGATRVMTDQGEVRGTK